MVLVDFYKAFDTLEWSYFNFPEYLIKWVSVIYININSHTINNGHMSKGFTVTKGIRQGCPWYPSIFVIAVESLAITLRRDVKIKCITQNGVEKNNQFADDTVIIIAAEDESLAEVVKVVDHFKQISGFWINKD